MSTATMIVSNDHAGAPSLTGDFLLDVTAMAEQIDRRLRRSLSPEQYAMVQDLVLATRISTIARDALEDRAEAEAEAA